MTTSAYAQTEVQTGVTRGKDYGVVYSLPKTQIELEIKANKVNYTPGEFSKYADRYLRLTNVSADPEEYWELTSVKVKSVGVPNSETTYFVKLKDKTVAPLMELTRCVFFLHVSNFIISSRKLICSISISIIINHFLRMFYSYSNSKRLRLHIYILTVKIFKCIS